MTRILYNNFDCFSGIAPVPLIGQRDTFIKYGEQWGEVTRITLNGILTGFCANSQFLDGGPPNFLGASGVFDGGDFTSSAPTSGVDGGAFYDSNGNLFNNQQYLISCFGKDFQSFQVVENGVTIINKPYCKVIDIDFPSNNYVKIIPFQIELECYESGFFSGTYGILEPRNEFTYTQNKDQSISIEHTLSCRGFNTSQNNSNALQNARNYIAQNSGYNGAAVPYFIKICSGLNPCLISQTENINRVQSTYGITERYIFDPFFNSGVLRYSTTFDSGINDGLCNVRVAGSLKSCRNYPVDFVRNRYLTFDSFSAAVDSYSGATNGLIDLNPLYLSSGVTIDPFAKTINFQIAFNNDPSPNPYFEYAVNFQRDNLTDITQVSINGTVRGRGELNQRYQKVLNYYTGVNLYNLAVFEYQNDGYQYLLNPIYITQGISKNPYTAEVALQSTFSDRPLFPSGFASFDYTISQKPSYRQYSAIPILNGMGGYVVNDLGYICRSVATIQGAAVIDPSISVQSGINLLSNYLNYQALTLYSGYNRVALEAQEISQGNKNIARNVTFSTTYSWEGNEIIL